MTAKTYRLGLVIFLGGMLLVVHAQQQTPPSRTDDSVALNDAPQKQYPVISLEAQKAAMQRIEEMRRKRRIKGLRDKIPPADWIQIPYHGLLLDANLDVIEMTPETVSKIQRSLFSILQKSALTETLKTRGRELKSRLFDERFKGQERLLARSLATDSLLAESGSQLQARYAWRNRLLRGYAGASAVGRELFISPALSQRMQGLSLKIDAPPPPQARSEYVEACRAQGVPIPPDWPDVRWISQGPLELVFISAGLKAEVFAYKDPEVPGVCYALPRRDGTSIKLLGIICQGATTGKACFWDNKTANNDPITGPEIMLDIDSIGNGMTLAETCTECHRGDNVFNIHPGTALDLSRPDASGGPYLTDSADANGTPIRYTPIGQPHWVNPPPLVLGRPSPGQKSCTICHSLPQTSAAYCSSVLKMAALETMPPLGPARAKWPPGPPPVNPQYTDHVGLLSGCP